MPTLSEIQISLKATWLQKRTPDALVELLLTDSRQRTQTEAALFFALNGERHDGHRFLSELYDAGVRHFVVGRSVDISRYPEANILLVNDTLVALQALAAWQRAKFDLPVIGVTGSNGKTIVKEWLYQLLSPDRDVLRSPKSYNSQVGVPLSVWPLQDTHDLAIFEAGISKPGEMERLEAMVRPTIGLFTNIGPAHREGFPSKRDKAIEKRRLFKAAEVLVYCKDHALIDELAQENPAHWRENGTPLRCFTWSRENMAADLYVAGIEPAVGHPGTRLTGHLKRGALEAPTILSIEVPFSDPASLENVSHCWAVLLLLGLPHGEIANRMARLEPVEMRLEIKAGINRCALINDFYNNDTAALRIALQFAAQQTRTGPLTVILSDILQSGQNKSVLYEKVASIVAAHGVNRFIGIGADIPAVKKHLPETIETLFFTNTDAFLAALPTVRFHDERILLKGARPFAFERIAARLEQKAHKTVLEINLSAVVHNLNVYKKHLSKGVRTMAMVKAAAYGSGSEEVAKLLEFHKVDYLGVAYADEGVELREAGVHLPILVLNPEAASFDLLHRYCLEPEVYSLRLLSEMIAFMGTEKSLPIHLKLDTGMHRLGFETADLPALCQQLRRCPNLKVQTVFSHLAASDAPAHDAFTHRQAAAFSAMYSVIREALGYAPLRHLANTAGIARFPAYHFDMVRLGIGLYGVGGAWLDTPLRTVNTLKATISQIKTIAPGDTVGYNRNSGPLERPVRIATISVGYADGFLRLAGNGRYAVGLHGQLAPTIGNVCMDMTMIDVSHILDAKEGDTVTVFGDYPTVETLAACLQTIPYEVFTNLSERVKRVYLQE